MFAKSGGAVAVGAYQSLDDPELQAETRRLRVVATLSKGETLAALVDELMNTPAELLQTVERLMK